MKNKFLRKWPFIIPGAVAMAPVALAASCGTSSSEPDPVIPNTTEVAFTQADFEAIQVSGNTRYLKFTVPKRLTNLDENKVRSDSGTTVALTVLGRLNQPTLAGQTTNLTFMPLPVLEYYLAGKLAFDQGKLIATADNDNTTKIDIVAQYKSLFGFNPTNVLPSYMGLWDRNNLEYKIEPIIGYSVPAAIRDKVVKARLTDNAFKSYVNLDFSTVNTNNLTSEYSITASSHTFLRWDKQFVLPESWKTFVKLLRYADSSTADVASASAALPTRLPYDETKRKLFVLFEPMNDSYFLPVSPVDISSVIANVVTDVSDAPNYASNNLATAKLSMVNSVLTLSAPLNLALPTGAKLLYSIGESSTETYSDTALVDRLRSTGWSTNLTVYAFVTSTDTQKFVVSNNLRKSIMVDLGQYINTNGFFETIKTLTVTSTSTPANLSFNFIPTLTTNEGVDLSLSVDRIEYIIGDFPTEALAQQAPGARWITLLPQSFVTGNNLNFWARLVPKFGYTLSQTYANLTESSRLLSIQPLVDTSTLRDRIFRLSANSTSYNDNVVWDNQFDANSLPPALVGKVLRYEYLVSNVKTAEAAAKATGWSLTLPTTVSYDNTTRGLWLRIVPAAGYRLSDEYFNLTESSKIQTILSKVDSQPGFDAIDLSKIKFIGSQSFLTIDTSAVKLPQGVNIYYKIKTDAPFRSEGEFKEWLINNASTLVAFDVATLVVKLSSSNANYYSLLNDKQAAPDTTAFSINTIKAVPQAIKDALNNLSISSALSKTPEAVVWANKPVATAPVTKIQYLSGFYSTFSVALQAPESAWGDLPTSLVVNPAQRFLWARLVPAAGEAFGTDTYMDLTFTSNIRSVVYEVGTFVETATAEAIRKLTFSADSVHSAVTWNYPVLDTDTKNILPAFKVQYLYSTSVVSDADLNSDTFASWSDTLPSTVDYDPARRFIYVRVKPNAGYHVNSLTARRYEAASTIHSLADVEVEAANIDLSVVSLTGSYVNANIDTSRVNALPQGVEIVYRIGLSNGSWMTKDAFKEYLRNTKSDSLIDPNYFSTIRVKLQPTSSFYILSQNQTRETMPNTSGFTGIKSVSVPAALSAAINALRVTSDSTINNLKWSALPNISSYEGIGSLQFYVGPLSTQLGVASTSTIWNVNLPPSVQIDLAQRNLWVRVFPLAGYQIVETEQYYNLTTTSGITSITIDLSSDLSVLKADYEGVGNYVPKATVSGTTVSWTPATLPAGMTDKFDISYLLTTEVATDFSAASKFLPLTTNVNPAMRFFYIILAPKSGYSLSGSAQQVYDVTAQTGLRT